MSEKCRNVENVTHCTTKSDNRTSCVLWLYSKLHSGIFVLPTGIFVRKVHTLFNSRNIFEVYMMVYAFITHVKLNTQAVNGFPINLPERSPHRPTAVQMWP